MINPVTHVKTAFATAASDEQPACAPSGTKVALMNDDAGTPTIYVTRADGTGRRVLTAGYQPDWQFLP